MDILSDLPLYTPRKLRVVCVGAGFGGLMLAYQHKQQEELREIADLTIYEKNPDVGGVWYENRYPGVMCDAPAHIYTFTWEPNPDWSSFYASGKEIWEYIRRTTTKYGLDEHVQFRREVVSAHWHEADGQWHLRIQNKEDGSIVDDCADVLVNAHGALNRWKWPDDVPGLHEFQGVPVVHSADWNLGDDDNDTAWMGKRIALIGNGSSGVQLLPQLAAKKRNNSVFHYVRGPTWIPPPMVADQTPEGKNFVYTEEQKQNLRDDPAALLALRKSLEDRFAPVLHGLLADTPEHAYFESMTRAHMEAKLGGDQDLCARLIPDAKTLPVGCRRLTPGEGYLEALQQANVELITEPIRRVTATGVVSGGGEEEDGGGGGKSKSKSKSKSKKENGDEKEIKVDLIVCATGFDVSYVPSFDVIGRHGVRLADQWNSTTHPKEPQAYFAVCVPGFPNYFFLNGPNAPVGHGSLLPTMEWAAAYVWRWCRKIAVEDLLAVAVTQTACDAYNVYAQAFLRNTVWSRCRSWYTNHRSDGRVVAMYAGSVLHYGEVLQAELRAEDFAFVYRSVNRFRFLGNGFTRRETQGGDLSFYLTK